jgi:erythromycin esterase-like protein
MFRLLLMAIVMLSAPAAAPGRPATASSHSSVLAPPDATNYDSALAAVVHDLCSRDVALLGEADHGDGRTVAFKVALVQALVTRCHYDAVFFEGSHYEFLNFSRRLRTRQGVSPDMVSAAIGGLWKFDQELAPLIPFLFQRARSGRLVLGGIDDQLGGFEQPYANDGLPAELTAYLEGDRRASCREILRQRIYHDYQGPDAGPDRTRELQCLVETGRAVSRSDALGPPAREELLEMVANAERYIGRDGTDMASYIPERDRSMYLDFRWLAGRLPPRSRIIVWAATSHIAKDGAATDAYARGRNLGSYLHEIYGRRAFALGFSAYSGSHRWSRREPTRDLPVAAADSLEASAMADSNADTAYLGPARLAALGTIQGSLFLHAPVTARWDSLLDGVVVFREERPPRRAN